MPTNRTPSPGDQADGLRRLARGASPDDRLVGPPRSAVVLTGAKGGVGVTRLTLELARAVAATGRRVVAVDAHLGQADLALMAGLAVEGGPHLGDVLTGSRSPREALRRVGQNLWLLPAARSPQRAEALAGEAYLRLRGALALFDRQADLILIDGGSGLGADAELLWRLAHRALLVTTPDGLSVLDAYAVLKSAATRRVATRAGLVVNRAAGPGDAAACQRRLEATCQRFLSQSVTLVGHAPEYADGADWPRVLAPLVAELAPRPAKTLAA